MSPSPPVEQDDEYDSLISRLNALKDRSPSPPRPLPGLTPSKHEKNERDIEARFRRLASGQGLTPTAPVAKEPKAPTLKKEAWETLSTDIPHNQEDDQTLEELLQELGEPRDFGDEEDSEMQRLLREANSLLPEEMLGRSGPERQGEVVKGLGASGSSRGPETARTQKDSDIEDEEAAEEYITQVLAGLEVERADPGFLHDEAGEGEDRDVAASTSEQKDFSADAKTPPNKGERDSDSNEGDDPLSLPSAPSDLPTEIQRIAAQDERTEDDLAARLASLSLPSTPPFSPRKPTAKHTPTSPADILRARIRGLRSGPKAESSLKHFTDEEIESWCVLCNEDATVRCFGCEGDLYCQVCWDQGHKGPDAGLEERSHRAVVFNRGEGGRDGRERRKIAA